MELYWQLAKQGQRLMLVDGERVERIGGVRETSHGFDAFAITFSYEPDRARRGMDSMEEAKAFVESFSPWSLYVEDTNIAVEAGIRPLA